MLLWVYYRSHKQLWCWGKWSAPSRETAGSSALVSQEGALNLLTKLSKDSMNIMCPLSLLCGHKFAFIYFFVHVTSGGHNVIFHIHKFANCVYVISNSWPQIRILCACFIYCMATITFFVMFGAPEHIRNGRESISPLLSQTLASC